MYVRVKQGRSTKIKGVLRRSGQLYEVSTIAADVEDATAVETVTPVATTPAAPSAPPTFPSLGSGDANKGLLWTGSGWVGVDMATQAELDAALALKANAADAAAVNELQSCILHEGDSAANVVRNIFVAQFPLKVKSCSLAPVSNNAHIAGPPLKYWTFYLGFYRWNASTGVADWNLIARKSTWSGDPNGGEQHTAYRDWNMDAVAWANTTLQKGDVVAISQAQTDVPPALARRYWTVRYEPV